MAYWDGFATLYFRTDPLGRSAFVPFGRRVYLIPSSETEARLRRTIRRLWESAVVLLLVSAIAGGLKAVLATAVVWLTLYHVALWAMSRKLQLSEFTVADLPRVSREESQRRIARAIGSRSLHVLRGLAAALLLATVYAIVRAPSALLSILAAYLLGVVAIFTGWLRLNRRATESPPNEKL